MSIIIAALLPRAELLLMDVPVTPRLPQLRPIAPPEPPAAPPARYSHDGQPAVEARIAADQRRLSAQLATRIDPAVLRGVFLVGSYGRGDGGYQWQAGRALPINGYDYVVLVRGTDARQRHLFQQRVQHWCAHWQARLHLPLHCRVLREERLTRSPVTLAAAELCWTRRLLHGQSDVPAALPTLPFHQVAAGEITRLLLRRGQLLLHTRQQLQTSALHTAAGRAQFFAALCHVVLGCGDAYLAAAGLYHPASDERLARLTPLATVRRRVLALYQLAHHYQQTGSADELTTAVPLEWQARVVWLWSDTLRYFETWRRGQPVPPTWEQDCTAQNDKGQRSSGGWWQQVQLNGQLFGWRNCLRHPRWALQHPRARLMSALPVLLTSQQHQPERMVTTALALPNQSAWTTAAATVLQYAHV